MTEADALATLGSRLWQILERYRDRLEPNDIYGLPTLRWPGARAHDYFAGVRIAPRHVALHLLPVYDHPEVMADASAALQKRLTGKATFNLKAGDEPLLDELDDIVTRCYELYAAAHLRPLR
jgi:hypothetical protein